METENWLWYYEQVHLTSLSSCDPSPPSGSAQLQLLWGWRVRRGESFQKYHLHIYVCPEGHMAARGTLSSLLISFSNFEWMCKWLVSICVHVHVCACSCIWRCLPLLSSILSFGKPSLAGPGTHQLGRSSLPPASCLSSSPVLGLQVCTIPQSFFMGDGDLNSGPSCLFGKCPQSLIYL